MSTCKNLHGQRFGRLTVVGRAESDAKRNSRWQCLCDCGERRTVYQFTLLAGTTVSCGCFHRERAAEINRTHGQAKSPEHRSWTSMLGRCLNKRNDRFAAYGGRGITVCQRWIESFENFRDDMGPRPSPSHTLDRVDNNGNYEPGNCRWATRSEQQQNRRDTVFVELHGQRKTLHAWAAELGINRVTLDIRLRRGWSPERALTEPVQEKR